MVDLTLRIRIRIIQPDPELRVSAWKWIQIRYITVDSIQIRPSTVQKYYTNTRHN